MPIGDLPRFGCCNPCLSRFIILQFSGATTFEEVVAAYEIGYEWISTTPFTGAFDSIESWILPTDLGTIFLDSSASGGSAYHTAGTIIGTGAFSIVKVESCDPVDRCVEDVKAGSPASFCGSISTNYLLHPHVVLSSTADYGTYTRTAYYPGDPSAPECCDFDP